MSLAEGLHARLKRLQGCLRDHTWTTRSGFGSELGPEWFKTAWVKTRFSLLMRGTYLSHGFPGLSTR